MATTNDHDHHDDAPPRTIIITFSLMIVDKSLGPPFAVHRVGRNPR
jgi:hypothetical protein